MTTLELERPDLGFGGDGDGYGFTTELAPVAEKFPEGGSETIGVLQFMWQRLFRAPNASPAMSEHFGHAEAHNDPNPQFADPVHGHLG